MSENRLVEDSAEDLLYEMEAVYRQSEDSIFSSDLFTNYEDLYSDLTDRAAERYGEQVFTELIPLLDRREYGDARDLLEEGDASE